MYIQKTLEDGAAQAFILSNQVPSMEVHLYKMADDAFVSSFDEQDSGELIFSLLDGKKITPIKS